MEDMKAQGLAKTIGVSNYLPQHLDWIMETCQTPPAVNQIEFHPYLQHVELLKYHKEKVRNIHATTDHICTASQRRSPPTQAQSIDNEQGIATEAYGPLTSITKAANGPVDDILNVLSKKYAVTPGEICLRWCIDQDVVPITTSSKEQRLSDYLRAMTFKLTPKEISQVRGARRWTRTCANVV